MLKFRESKYRIALLTCLTILILAFLTSYLNLANNHIVFSFKPSNAVSGDNSSANINSSANNNISGPSLGPNSETKVMELFLAMPENNSASSSHFVSAYTLDSLTEKQVDNSKIYISVFDEQGTLLGLYSGSGNVSGSWVSTPGTIRIVANASAEGYKPATKQSSFTPSLGISNFNSSENGETCEKVQPIGVKVNSFETDPNDYHPAADAIDGNTDSWWSNQGIPSWLEIQEGKNVSICSIKITWNKGAERQYDFSISTSTDGNIYNKIYSGKSEKIATTETYNLASDDVGVIKIDITGSSSNKGWVSIKEINIFAR